MSRWQTSVVLLLGLQAIVADEARSQSVASLSGQVVDSTSRPLVGSLIFVDDGALSTTADATGRWQLIDVPPGTHVLSYRSAGYSPHSFNIEVTTGRTVDIGVMVLTPGPHPVATLQGTVFDVAGSLPVTGALIELNGDLVAVTDSTGAFNSPGVPVAWGRNTLRTVHRAFSETTVIDEFWVANPAESFEFEVGLDIPPLVLPGVEVAGPPPVPPKLEGFFERRAERDGVFFTREEIAERNPRRTSDLFRNIRINRERAANTFGNAQSATCGGPLVFVDGFNLGNLAVAGELMSDLDRRVSPEELAGVEIYSGTASVPIEFSLFGSECGVVVLWTR